MLGLKLRDEFKGKRLRGTSIELSNETKTGATQLPVKEFLSITYPTRDLLKAIEAVGPDQGRPVAVIGERGLGKSHLLATIYHALTDPASTGAWLNSWGQVLKEPRLAQLPLRDGLLVIGESLHRQRYKFLWDLLFERHPNGNYVRGKWEGMGAAKTDVPDPSPLKWSDSKYGNFPRGGQVWRRRITNRKRSLRSSGRPTCSSRKVRRSQMLFARSV